MQFIQYPKCTTCQKAKKWLDSHGKSYTERNIKEQKPTMEELKEWQKLSGKDTRKLFNTSGMLYREMNLKDRLQNMSEEEMFELLASDGMMVKRPILVGEDKAFFGFKEQEWETL